MKESARHESCCGVHSRTGGHRGRLADQRIFVERWGGLAGTLGGDGWITWQADIKHVHRGNDPYGAPQTLTEVYREKAVYVLSGGKVVGGVERARMTGSGTGTDVIYS